MSDSMDECIRRIEAQADQVAKLVPLFEQRSARQRGRKRPSLELLESWLREEPVFPEQRLIALLWLSTDPREGAQDILERYEPFEDEHAHGAYDLFATHRLAKHYARQNQRAQRYAQDRGVA